MKSDLGEELQGTHTKLLSERVSGCFLPSLKVGGRRPDLPPPSTLFILIAGGIWRAKIKPRTRLLHLLETRGMQRQFNYISPLDMKVGLSENKRQGD